MFFEHPINIIHIFGSYTQHICRWKIVFYNELYPFFSFLSILFWFEIVPILIVATFSISSHRWLLQLPFIDDINSIGLPRKIWNDIVIDISTIRSNIQFRNRVLIFIPVYWFFIAFRLFIHYPLWIERTNRYCNCQMAIFVCRSV